MWARIRQAALWATVLGFNLLLFVPSTVWGEPRRSVFRLSLEYGFALLALALAARTPFRVWVRALVVTLYSAILLFLVYHHAFKSFFLREPAVVEDWRLAINLVHFLSEMTAPRWVAFTAGCVMGAIGLVTLLERSCAVLQRMLASARPRRLVAVAAGGLMAAGVSLAFSGSVAKPLADNYRASVAVQEKLGRLRGATPDERNLALLKVRLAKRPNFYVLMVESYGEVLTTWDMTDAYRTLMARVQARLQKAGFTARTAYSAAPVHGGTTWFSIATLQTGILIDQPRSYEALASVGARIPTLTKFFRSQGYHTSALQPGMTNRTGLGRFDMYNHERLIDAQAIGYRGQRWGFGVIPDQYSLGLFREHALGAAAEPRYLFYVGVSTHFPWGEHVPPYVRDFKTLDGGAGGLHADDTGWAPLPGLAKITSDFRRSYFRSIEYEWRVLLDLLEADRSRELVVIVMGDHQPRLESNPPGELTFNAPVHVLSKDPAFVERFAQLGFQPGLYAEPGRAPPLLHEGLFSLWVTQLAGSYGTNETKRFAEYFPEGIGLAGLNP